MIPPLSDDPRARSALEHCDQVGRSDERGTHARNKTKDLRTLQPREQKGGRGMRPVRSRRGRSGSETTHHGLLSWMETLASVPVNDGLFLRLGARSAPIRARSGSSGLIDYLLDFPLFCGLAWCFVALLRFALPE